MEAAEVAVAAASSSAPREAVDVVAAVSTSAPRDRAKHAAKVKNPARADALLWFALD